VSDTHASRAVPGILARLVRLFRGAGGTWVFIDGVAHLIVPAAAGRRTASRDDESALSAPMPATVIAVNVEPGQAVLRGDVLITLEAMKMELAINAPRDGRVRRVACRAGELVQPGAPLVELE
jgi:3-methylcrotonyl-CoA carboxylase alpha subunit